MRITHLDTATFTLLGTDYTRCLRNVDVSVEAVTQSGRAIGERDEDAVETKRRATLSFSALRTATGARQSALTATLLTYASNALLGRFRSYTVSGTTQVDEGSGGADQWEFPYAVSTDAEVRGQLQIASAAELMDLMIGAGSGRIATLKIATGGFAGWLPVLLSGNSHGVDASKIQTEDFTMKLKGDIDPTKFSGDPLLVSAFSGTASGAFSLDTGVGDPYIATDGMVITSFGFTVADGQVIEDNFTCAVCGAISNVEP